MSARSRWYWLVTGSLVALGMHACAAGEAKDDPFEDDSGSGGSQGGAAGAGGAGGEGGEASPCQIDCSTIQTDACHEAICDEASGQCVVVDAEDGTMCDDELFCTVEDSCVAGACTGAPNDCGISPAACLEVVCNEDSLTCTQQPLVNGTPCQPADLCTVGGSCNNGLCTGGVYNDCFLAPVPNFCHVAVCNPSSGDCEPQPANDGADCIDYADLCSEGNTCLAGVCGGGAAKDCSHLTVGCFDGICDAASGQCDQLPIPAGGMCAAATDDCNVGECDALGACNPIPANEGGACDEDACFLGQTCASGVCQGGTQIVTCTDGDGCCPATCDISNDDDCGCHFALISQEAQFSDNVIITGLLTTWGHTFDIYDNNGTGGVHTSNAALLAGYETIIYHKHDDTISATEMNNLVDFVNNGGSLLVTGYDSLASPTDTMLGTVINCTGPTDYTGVTNLVFTNDTHPIATGPAQTFALGAVLTASSSDHDDCNPGAGALQIVSVSAAPKIVVTDNVGPGMGKVIYWNGNGSVGGPLTDWTGAGGTQPALQNLFVNVVMHMCD
jgi:hypothetical protein